jgi:hypothetical protein
MAFFDDPDQIVRFLQDSVYFCLDYSRVVSRLTSPGIWAADQRTPCRSLPLLIGA